MMTAVAEKPAVPARPAPTPADRVLVGAIYRAMRMIAAAVRVRYGIAIMVEMLER